MAKPTPLPSLHPRERVREVAPIVLAIRIDDVRRYEFLVKQDQDMEAVHDMRVASRRLRAALTFFELPSRLERVVKRLQDALGGVRDVQVQSGALSQLARSPASGQRSLRQVVGRLERWLPARVLTLENELERWREKTLPTLERVAPDMDSGRHLGGRHYQQELPRRLKALRRRIHRFDRNQDAHTAHRLRIAAKKLRYDAELLEAFQPEAKLVLKRLVPLQEALGDLHDLDVTLALLGDRRLVGACPSSMAGVLTRLQRRRAGLVQGAHKAAQVFAD